MRLPFQNAVQRQIGEGWCVVCEEWRKRTRPLGRDYVLGRHHCRQRPQLDKEGLGETTVSRGRIFIQITSNFSFKYIEKGVFRHAKICPRFSTSKTHIDFSALTCLLKRRKIDKSRTRIVRKQSPWNYSATVEIRGGSWIWYIVYSRQGYYYNLPG